MTMSKEQTVQLAKNYVNSWKQIKFRGDYVEDETMLLLQVYDYIFGSCIYDLNKFVDDELVEFTVGCDLQNKPEIIELSLEDYLNSDLFYN